MSYQSSFSQAACLFDRNKENRRNRNNKVGYRMRESRINKWDRCIRILKHSIVRIFYVAFSYEIMCVRNSHCPYIKNCITNSRFIHVYLEQRINK